MTYHLNNEFKNLSVDNKLVELVVKIDNQHEYQGTYLLRKHVDGDFFDISYNEVSNSNDLVINSVMASNDIILNEFGNDSDWIELFNPSGGDISINDTFNA